MITVETLALGGGLDAGPWEPVRRHDGGALRETLESTERVHLLEALQQTSWNLTLIDRAVEQEILRALTPAEMQVALDGIAQSLKEQKTTQRSLDMQLRDLDDGGGAVSRIPRG